MAAEQREEYEMALGAGRNEGEIEAPDLAGMKREDVAEARGTALGLAGMSGGDEGKARETALGSAGMNGGDEGKTCGTVLESSGINRGDAAKECGHTQTSPEEQAVRHIVRRLLYYRGGQTAGAVQERYFLADGVSERILNALCASGDDPDRHPAAGAFRRPGCPQGSCGRAARGAAEADRGPVLWPDVPCKILGKCPVSQADQALQRSHAGQAVGGRGLFLADDAGGESLFLPV